MVIFLAIGGDTEDAMQEDVWEQGGLCEPAKATGRPCDYEDGTEECQKARARNRPCVFSMDNFIRMLKRGDDADDARAVRAVKRTEKRTWHWIPGYQKCTSTTEVVGEKAADEAKLPYWRLLRPEWVPADQPTEHRGIGGLWLKLRLQSAESELAPRPHRVRARPAPAAMAWGPERILGALRLPSSSFVGQVEAHVRTLAAVPANIIQRVREGR
jgi:hypothetical protein